MNFPAEDFRSIARILAAGYLRLRDRRGRESPLASPPTSSPHGHEVINGTSVVENLEFADYDSLEDSCRDYVWLIHAVRLTALLGSGTNRITIFFA